MNVPRRCRLKLYKYFRPPTTPRRPALTTQSSIEKHGTRYSWVARAAAEHMGDGSWRKLAIKIGFFDLASRAAAGALCWLQDF